MSTASTVPSGHVAQVSLRIDDLGPAGHVSNVAAVRVIDEARMNFFGHSKTSRVGYHDGLLTTVADEVQYLVGQHTIEYVTELWYSRAPLVVTLWVTGIGHTTFSIATTVSVSEGEPPSVLAESAIVLVDRKSRTPWPLSDTLRADLSRHLGPPIELRDRRRATTATRALGDRKNAVPQQ